MQGHRSSHALVDATQGVIWKQHLRLFYPIALGTLFQLLYNMADAMVVGKFVGKEALAAVGGSASTLAMLLIGVFNGMSSGATVIIAQFYGSRDREKVSASVGTAIFLGCAFGLLLSAGGFLIAPRALGWMNTPADTMEYSILYLRIYIIGSVPLILYNMGSGILRAVGDSKRPLLYLIICCFLNIGLDLLFVIVFSMGIAGAAWATVIAQLISAILVLTVLSRDDDCYRLQLKNLRPHPQLMIAILRVGLPAGLQSCMYALSNIIIMTAINRLQTDFVAAWSATGKIDSIFWMLMNALGLALLTVIGQNYGAGLLDRIKQAVKYGMLIAFSITVVVCSCLVLFSRPLMTMFVDDSIVISMGMKILYFFAPSYLTFVCIEILSSTLRGMGDSLIPAIITSVGICGLRVAWVWWVAPMITGLPQWIAVLLSYPVSWGITSIAFCIYYPYRYKHLRTKLEQGAEHVTAEAMATA